MKHLLKMLDLSGEEILEILDLADQLKYELKHSIPHPYLKGKSIGLIFQKASTRTRVSFETGMYVSAGRSCTVPVCKRFADWTGRTGTGYCKSIVSVSERYHDSDI